MYLIRCVYTNTKNTPCHISIHTVQRNTVFLHCLFQSSLSEICFCFTVFFLNLKIFVYTYIVIYIKLCVLFRFAELTPEQQKLLLELRRRRQEVLLEIQVSSETPFAFKARGKQQICILLRNAYRLLRIILENHRHRI